MSRTNSTMLPLGTKAMDFSLTGVDGEFHFSEITGKSGYLITFICNHCPFVKHLKKEFSTFTKSILKKNIHTIAINSNDIEQYPEDNLERMKEDKEIFNYGFPYLLDDSQEVAKGFKAACTPDFYLFDEHKILVYRGQFDDSRPENGVAITGQDLEKAIDNLLQKKEPLNEQRPSIGCNIKWKPGNEPDYYKKG